MSQGVANEQEWTPLLQQDRRIRPAVKGLITNTDSVLLQQERHTDGEMFWTLPGGGIASQETATRALARELNEELQTASVVGKELGWVPYAHSGWSQTISVYRVFTCALLEEPQENAGERVYASKSVNPREPPTRTLPQVQWVLQQYATQQ